MKNINSDLLVYALDSLMPIYDTFDGGHNSKHIRQTISRALRITNFLNDENIDKNIVFISAAMHDIGMKIERKNHAKHSGEIVRKEKYLHNWFTTEEIEMIAQAVEDHSTSSGHDPRNIYGKIVSDADKDNDVSTSLLRAYNFTVANNPNFSKEECYKNVFSHLCTKFGDNGLVKLWFQTPVHAEFCDTMNMLSKDFLAFKIEMDNALAKNG